MLCRRLFDVEVYEESTTSELSTRSLDSNCSVFRRTSFSRSNFSEHNSFRRRRFACSAASSSSPEGEEDSLTILGYLQSRDAFCSFLMTLCGGGDVEAIHFCVWKSENQKLESEKLMKFSSFNSFDVNLQSWNKINLTQRHFHVIISCVYK